MANLLLQPLMQREPSEKPVLSLYLDMSVNSENKRSYQIFLDQQRLGRSELDSDRPSHHREPLGEALDRAERWLADNYLVANRGIAIFVEMGGDWIEGVQLSLPVQNRLAISDRPVIAPLVELLSGQHQYGIIMVDREHCRIAGLFLGELQHYQDIRPHAYPTPHDVKKGGWAARDYQKYKEEETWRFYRMFADALDETDRARPQDYWILLGTEENLQEFRPYLAKAIDERVVFLAPSSVDATDAEILERLQPFVTEHAVQDEAIMVDVLRERVRTGYFAIAGVHDTLEQLQEGRVGTLVMARDFSKNGAQCTCCGFYLDLATGGCPYCGGELRGGVDLAEPMIRMATSQGADLEFVDPHPIAGLDGVGALLRF